MNHYTAKILDRIENQPGTWNSLRIGVFILYDEREQQIGEYMRNYPSFFNTFFPFSFQGKDYALYSPNYTTTRVMELPSCRDIDGEAPSGFGFCPVEYYVPGYIVREWIDSQDTIRHRRINNPQPSDFLPKVNTYFQTNPETGEKYQVETPTRITVPHSYYPFGFVSGCIWADDHSWKVQYLDLSQVDQGVIKRDERFGYIELPDNIPLRNAIDMSEYLYDDTDTRISITIKQHFRLDTGSIIDPFD